MKYADKVKLTITSGGLILFSLYITLFFIVQYNKIKNPNNAMHLLTNHYRLCSLIAAMPGGGSDMAGFVTLVNTRGQPCGTIPISAIWMAREVKWQKDLDSIKLVGEWSFKSSDYNYWNNNKQVSKKLLCSK